MSTETGEGHLEAKRDHLQAHLSRIEATELTTAPQRWRRHVGRTAFCIRFWEESVRAMLIAEDRAKLQAGFSPAIHFRGEHAVMPDPEQFEDFGQIDWEGTLQGWRFLSDPDRFPLRLPGFTLVGGKVILDGLLSTEDYARRCELFKLNEYISLFKAVAGERRCAHCTKLLNPSASDQKRYCSTECSQAARQKAYRRRQKEMIIRGRPLPSE